MSRSTVTPHFQPQATVTPHFQPQRGQITPHEKVGSIPWDQRVGSIPWDQKVGHIPWDQKVGHIPWDQKAGKGSPIPPPSGDSSPNPPWHPMHGLAGTAASPATQSGTHAVLTGAAVFAACAWGMSMNKKQAAKVGAVSAAACLLAHFAAGKVFVKTAQ